MKVPVGIFLGSVELAKGKYLISSVDMGHYLKLPSGIPLDAPLKGDSVPVIEKLKQVFVQILKVCERDNDTSLFKKATEKLPKVITRNFTKNLELKEKEVVMLDISQTPDLMPPNGELLRKLRSSYPDFYKNTKKKAKLSKIIEMVESEIDMFILNDLYIPQENRKVIEYGEKLTKDMLTTLRPEINAIIQGKKKEDFIDELSTGEEVIRMDLYNYYAVPLKKSDEPVTEEFLKSDEFKLLLQGDPEVFYLPESTFLGIMLFETNPQISYLIKKVFKLNFFHFIDEFNSVEKIYENIKKKNPLCAILSIESNNEIENIIKNLKDIREFQVKNFNNKTEIIFILENKTSEIENKIRSNGFTFILDKKNIINNFNQFNTMLSNILNMLEE